MNSEPRARIEAATVAMIHECRRLRLVPSRFGSASQWGLLAEAALVAVDDYERPVVERLSSAAHELLEIVWRELGINDGPCIHRLKLGDCAVCGRVKEIRGALALAESNQQSSQPANDGATVRVIDAADVRDLLRIAYEARDRADGGLVVITPELALSIADCLRAALAAGVLPEGKNHKCQNCGQLGAHFVPPSFGEPGFFYCEKRAAGSVVEERP